MRLKTRLLSFGVMAAVAGATPVYAAAQTPADQVRTVVTLDIPAGSAAAGIISDDILQKGWDHIDEHDLRTWLRRHGANRITLDSGPVRARRWRRRRARARRLLRAHRHLG